MIDLVKLIDKNDLINMEKFIINSEHEISEETGWIGMDKFLCHWNPAKQRLFHLLDDKLIYEKQVVFKKPEYEIERSLQDLLFNHPLWNNFIKFCSDNLYSNFKNDKEHAIIREVFYDIRDLNKSKYWKNNKIDFSVNIKKADYLFWNLKEQPKHDLQLQPGMQPMKALRKVLEFFGKFDEWKVDFEDFRINHSRIFNDAKVKGQLCFSIHPFDFITMSDNASGWDSCMSWKVDGCYHAGTVEMMNSNNVICCYLKSESSDYEPYKGVIWNNKKWRQLVYVTPEIICGGYPYPYSHDDLTLEIINTLRELAKKNLKWTYTYGPEYYYDMSHVTSNCRMIYNKNWRSFDANKHNILFDTKCMYNDFLNKAETGKNDFLCVRNKVSKNLIISVSGKCDCLLCGNTIQKTVEALEKEGIREHDPSDYGPGGILNYNDRYMTGWMVCYECRQKSRCHYCGALKSKSEIIKIKGNNNVSEYVCKDCYDRKLFICGCGKVVSFFSNYSPKFYITTPKEDITIEQVKQVEKTGAAQLANGRWINLKTINTWTDENSHKSKEDFNKQKQEFLKTAPGYESPIPGARLLCMCDSCTRDIRKSKEMSVCMYDVDGDKNSKPEFVSFYSFYKKHLGRRKNCLYFTKSDFLLGRKISTYFVENLTKPEILD